MDCTTHIQQGGRWRRVLPCVAFRWVPTRHGLFSLFGVVVLVGQLLSTQVTGEYIRGGDASVDTLRYLEVSHAGHLIPVRLPYNQGKQRFSPCTYLLKDGTVVYGECGGLYGTPQRGQELLRIQCVEPGKLYYEWFGDAVTYTPSPSMPAVSLEARAIPYKIAYYDSTYTQLVATFDLRADNPYTKEKMPEIEVEQLYDSEMGFGQPSPGDEVAWLWTYSHVFFFDNGNTGITYRLYKQNAQRALLGIATTISILDTHGKLLYTIPEVDLDIVPVLVTQDEKYLALKLNTLIDDQNYPRRLGNPGIRIIDMDTGEVVYEDFTNMIDHIGAPVEYRPGLIRYRKVAANMEDTMDGLQVILDMRESVKYERHFSKEEWRRVSFNADMLYEKPRGLLDVYTFSSSKF